MKLLLLSLTSLSLISCSSVGTKNLEDFGNYVDLKPSITTKSEIFDKFGQPADVIYQGEAIKSPSKWIYVKADMHVNGWAYVPYVGVLAGGTSEENMTSQFNFDEKQRFLTLKTERDTSYTNSWVGLTRDTYRRSKDPKAIRVEDEMKRMGKSFNKKFAKKLGERRFE